MPHYVFFCEECRKEFTLVLHMDDLDQTVIRCPHCGSQAVHQAIAAFAAHTARKS